VINNEYKGGDFSLFVSGLQAAHSMETGRSALQLWNGRYVPLAIIKKRSERMKLLIYYYKQNRMVSSVFSRNRG
jgi:hypothetical protein